MPRNYRPNHHIDKAFGAYIKDQRKKAGMSQDDLAKACHLTFQQIQKYEKGTNRVSVSRLHQLAAALKSEPWLMLLALKNSLAYQRGKRMHVTSSRKKAKKAKQKRLNHVR